MFLPVPNKRIQLAPCKVGGQYWKGLVFRATFSTPASVLAYSDPANLTERRFWVVRYSSLEA